eukprot:TRINITY_DN6480_c0_g1_i10.p1 TRINITY_DN6480_c0_g1~~TRINITY_DN6480_c0_g1_i10.p1  ORF type:complete len:304 (+),score=38.39 TRINITY_DN6480_c0_g1_i10:164-1075(+)
MNTMSLLTRDSIRRVCLRHSDGERDVTKLVNFSWLCVPVGFVLVPCLAFFFHAISNEEQRSMEYFSETIVLTAIGMFIEMLSEPFYILAQNLLLFKLRMYVESSAVLVKCIVTYLLVKRNFGLLSFGISHVIYGVILLVGYLSYFFFTLTFVSPPSSTPSSSSRDLSSTTSAPTTGITVGSDLSHVRNFSQLFPKYLGVASIDGSTLGLALTFEWQALQRLILQEGEKFVLYLMETLSNQGIYSVVNNLGFSFFFLWFLQERKMALEGAYEGSPVRDLIAFDRFTGCQVHLPTCRGINLLRFF